MSYAIVRNEKLIRDKAKGICTHNDRKAKNHSNKQIDPERTYLNYYIKKNELSYVKEFDRLRIKNNLQGQIRSNSIIICEMVFTSDNEFFNKIGEQETKRYFNECYKFMCNYKNLGEKNIISAVVHLDEETPHMHLIYIPVIHTKDKEGNNIEKVCARDFWKGKDSYRKLQNAYFDFVKGKGFDLERGLFVEETNRKHLTIQQYKNITNFENTKETLKNIKLKLPETPDLKDIKKVMLNRDEKIITDIIKPKDDLINRFENRKTELEQEFKNKEFDIEYKYKSKIKSLEKENNHLHKIIDKFYETVEKFIDWICHKFGIGESKELVRDFEEETHSFIDPVEQIKYEERPEKDWDLER